MKVTLVRFNTETVVFKTETDQEFTVPIKFFNGKEIKSPDNQKRFRQFINVNNQKKGH